MNNPDQMSNFFIQFQREYNRSTCGFISGTPCRLFGIKITTSKGGTVNAWPLVQEVSSLIPGDFTSLFQHLSFLCSFKFWIPKAQISKITESRFLYIGQFGVFCMRVLLQPTLLLYKLHWILFQFTLQYSAAKRTLCFINSSL